MKVYIQDCLSWVRLLSHGQKNGSVVEGHGSRVPAACSEHSCVRRRGRSPFWLCQPKSNRWSGLSGAQTEPELWVCLMSCGLFFPPCAQATCCMPTSRWRMGSPRGAVWLSLSRQRWLREPAGWWMGWSWVAERLMFKSIKMLKQLPFLKHWYQTSEFLFFLINHFNLLAGCIKMFKKFSCSLE